MPNIDPLNSEAIMHMDETQLIDSVIDSFSLERLERIRVHALLQVRADRLGIGPRIDKMIALYARQDEKAEREHRRETARRGAEIVLQLDNKGAACPTIENFLLIMKGDRRYSGIRFNLLANRPEVHEKGCVRGWTDADDAQSRAYIESRYHIHSEGKHRDALRLLFRAREYHPIREIVDTLAWDGTDRIEAFLATWAGAEDTDYTREVSRLIFAGGIHRLYSPGCKFDDVPVLVGSAQGEGKSTLVRWLAIHDSYYAEVTEFEGRESIEQLDGVWIGEIAELLALTRVKEQEAVKAYISRQRDRSRRPYGERLEELPRRCVFIGTTNNEQFLKDKTGNRRFYPVIVRSSGYRLYDHEKECREYIVQCWAEAKVRYDRGQMPNFADIALTEQYRQAQEEAMEDDWRVGAIGLFLDGKAPGSLTCVREIAHRALSANPEFPKDPTPKESQEIAQIMAKSFPEWKRRGRRRMPSYGLQRCWQLEAGENGPGGLLP